MDVMEVLVITSGCDPQARNEAGYTPLHVATQRGYSDVVGYLLSVLDSPPPEDLVSAAALAPPDIRSETIMSVLHNGLARSESPDRPDRDLPPAKRTRYSQILPSSNLNSNSREMMFCYSPLHTSLCVVLDFFHSMCTIATLR
ncbi:hypothetical protein OG21DRAFT_411775 [Imleria badia]|nr:hypothetical protein OG21DRAFT_411775 [Imleria badia]